MGALRIMWRKENLLVEHASDDADPDHVCLSDLGITKHAAEHTGLTATGEFMGTVDNIQLHVNSPGPPPANLHVTALHLSELPPGDKVRT